MANLAVLGGVLFCFALFARKVEGSVITAPMVFVTAGLVAGWTGLLDFGSATHAEGGSEGAHEVVLVAAELALVLLLFTDAARIDVRTLRGNPLPLRLLCIGLPLTILLGTVVAVALLADLELWECAIVAAVLAPTDAALGQAVVTNPALPLRVRQGLNVESGLNDGGSVPFLTLFIGLAAAEEGLGGGWLRFAVEQIGYGTLIGAAAGVAGGVALRRASARGWTVPLFEKLALAALAVILFVAADEVGGNGFIAAFVGGGAAGAAAGPVAVRALDLAEEDGELLNLAIFFIVRDLRLPCARRCQRADRGLCRAEPHADPDAAGRRVGRRARPAARDDRLPRLVRSTRPGLDHPRARRRRGRTGASGHRADLRGDDGHGPAQRVRARHHRRPPQPALRRRPGGRRARRAGAPAGR